MKQLIFSENSLIGLKDKNKFDVNEFIKNKPLSIQMFVDYLSIYESELNLDKKIATKYILESGIFFSKKIPLYQISGLKCDSKMDIEQLKKRIKEIKDKEKNTKTVYYCKDENDVLISVLYHFISRDYVIKQCSKCDCFYLKEDNYGTYCSECSIAVKQESKNKYIEKIQEKPFYNEFHNLYNKLHARLNKEYKYTLKFDEFIKIKNELLEKYDSQKILYDELEKEVKKLVELSRERIDK